MSSPAKTWTIVCFTADESVEAVPTKWINGEDCLWPVVTREKLNSHIRKCDFNSCWPSHKVRTFRNATYDDYGVARNKASKAENTSDLNTDDGNSYYGQSDHLVKRVRKKKILSSSESEDDEPCLGVLAKKRQEKIKKLSAPPTWMEIVDDTHENVENNGGNNFEEIVSQPQRTTSFNKSPDTSSADLKRAPDQIITDNLNNMCKSKKTNTGCCCNPQLLYNIQSFLIDINAKVGKCGCGKNKETEMPSNILEKSKVNFPIETNDSLTVFENYLLTPENYSALVLFFANLGGINLYEFIRRCMAPIMADTLSEQFSFLGKKGKIIFKNTSIAKAITEAAQKAGHSHNFKETEQRIGDWLRRAKERRLRVEQRNKRN